MPLLTPLVENRERIALTDRLQPRALAFLEPEFHAERFRHHQNVREQDHTVEIETLQRLEARLRCQRRVVAEVEKRPGPRPERAVLGQIAACLTHEPERWGLSRLPPKRRKEWLGVCIHGHESASVPGFVRLSSLNEFREGWLMLQAREEGIVAFIPASEVSDGGNSRERQGSDRGKAANWHVCGASRQAENTGRPGKDAGRNGGSGVIPAMPGLKIG